MGIYDNLFIIVIKHIILYVLKSLTALIYTRALYIFLPRIDMNTICRYRFIYSIAVLFLSLLGT